MYLLAQWWSLACLILRRIYIPALLILNLKSCAQFGARQLRGGERFYARD